MSLHDRIMEEVDAFPFNTMSTHVSRSHLDTYVEGFERAKQQAAQLATEADELMAEMAAALGHFESSIHDDCPAHSALAKYNTYMERNNEQD